MTEKQRTIYAQIEESYDSEVYVIYDSALELVSELLVFPTLEKAKSMFTELASSVNSPYYQNAKDYYIYKFFNVNNMHMSFTIDRKYIGTLAEYIDKDRVKFQRVVQTLNFVPNGFYKMPKELQDDVKQQIDDAIKTYVQEFVDVDSLVKKAKVNKENDNVEKK